MTTQVSVWFELRSSLSHQVPEKVGGCGSPWPRRFASGLGSAVPCLGSSLARWVAEVFLGYAGSRLVWARKFLDGAVPWLSRWLRFSLATQVPVRFGLGRPLPGQLPGLAGGGGSPWPRKFSSGSGSAVPRLGKSLARWAAAVLLGYAGFRLVAARQFLDWPIPWPGPWSQFPLTTQVSVWFGLGSTVSGQVPG